MDKYYQQGDVILIKTGSVPEGANKRNSMILAEGEATGHHHSVFGDAEIFDFNGGLFLSVYDDVVLKHQEHNPINLPSGTYIINIVREYDHFDEEARAVVD